jgi:hypothetical protein
MAVGTPDPRHEPPLAVGPLMIATFVGLPMITGLCPHVSGKVTVPGAVHCAGSIEKPSAPLHVLPVDGPQLQPPQPRVSWMPVKMVNGVEYGDGDGGQDVGPMA